MSDTGAREPLNILFVSATVPYPATDGGRIRVMNLVTRLCRIHKVTLLTFITSSADERGVEYLREIGLDVAGVRLLRPKLWGALRTLMQTLALRKPLTVAKYHSAEMIEALKSFLGSRNFDIIHFEMLHTGQFLLNLKARDEGMPGASRHYAAVLGEQNIDSSVWYRLAKSEPNLFRKLIFYSQYKSFVNYESHVCPQFDMCVCVSAQDQERLESLCPEATTGVVPNGVDLDYFKPGDVEEDDTRLVFTGSMDWHPNEDAVAYFCNHILPRVKAELPGVEFYIVGSNPTERVLKLRRLEGVTVTGSVEDVRPYITKAGIYVVPLRIGGGTRLKILQALAMEKAVISTTVGCEGLNLKPGKHIFVADEPEQFATETIRLMKNRPLRRRLGKNGRGLVRERFAWDIIVKGLDLEYRKLLRSTERTGK